MNRRVCVLVAWVLTSHTHRVVGVSVAVVCVGLSGPPVCEVPVPCVYVCHVYGCQVLLCCTRWLLACVLAR